MSALAWLAAAELLVLACKPQGQSQPPAPASEARQQDSFRQPDRLVSALALRPGDTVADVGSGGGYLTLRLARAVGPSGRVLATDIDPAALAALEGRARAAGLPQITIRRVAPGDPSLEPATYDLILLAEVDHLLADRSSFLLALIAALKPGGRIAISNKESHRAALLESLRGLPLAPQPAAVELPAQFLIFLVPTAAPG